MKHSNNGTRKGVFGTPRRVPSNAVIRADSRLMTVSQMAAKYGVAAGSMSYHMKRLGLTGRGRRPSQAAPAVVVATTAPAPEIAVAPAPRRPRLGIEDLALVAGLVERGISMSVAVQVVRVDAGMAA